MALELISVVRHPSWSLLEFEDLEGVVVWTVCVLFVDCWGLPRDVVFLRISKEVPGSWRWDRVPSCISGRRKLSPVLSLVSLRCRSSGTPSDRGNALIFY